MTETASRQTLTALLNTLEPEGDVDSMSVRDLIQKIGERAFAPLMLIPALILVSPLSGIPTLPTLGGLLIMLIAVQDLFGRDHLWLPDFLMRRRLSVAKLQSALTWLEKPARWVDRHTGDRLRMLTRSPFRQVALVIIILITAAWPPLELLPMVTSIGAFAVSLLCIGMVTRDGIYVAAGYVFTAAVVAVAVTLVSAGMAAAQ
ncbi:exopolysaccharide biosynthesis protein [Primorskyibacter marinus]|uniref:exopolysaccharide biosynthesis protein n=1 Tax=Primorskyibacter marinus TaxID=1977320 RepID=UPI000E309624|nr:exopolysaccharide biosynthesis protein [Primorskyibacter marinus]